MCKYYIYSSTMITLVRFAQGRLELFEPSELHLEAGVEREQAGARTVPDVEEAGVETGGAADGEVGALPEAPFVRQVRRHQRQPQALSWKLYMYMSITTM